MFARPTTVGSTTTDSFYFVPKCPETAENATIADERRRADDNAADRASSRAAWLRPFKRAFDTRFPHKANRRRRHGQGVRGGLTRFVAAIELEPRGSGGLRLRTSSRMRAAAVMELIRDPAVFVSLLLIAAIVGGWAASFVRVPRVVGYLLVGVALRAVLDQMQPDGAAGDHDAALADPAAVVGGIKTLALGLILFTLGGVFQADHVRSVGARALRISAAETLCVVTITAVGAGVVWHLTHDSNASTTVTAGVLIGIIALATAPAATVLVLQEYEARGVVSDTLLTLTALNNATCILLFHLAVMLLSSFGMLETAWNGERWLLLDLLMTSAGSIGLGASVGLLLSVLYARLALAEFILVFLAVVLSLGAFEHYLTHELHLSFNFLLTSLATGAAFANITVDQEPLHKTVSVLGRPLYAGFFVLAGYELHLADLSSLGALGAAYILLRIAGKYLGGMLGVMSSPGAIDLRPWLGMGLLCQAGVAIGLVDFLADTWGETVDGAFTPHPAAVSIRTVIYGSIVIFELLGPVALRQTAIAAGEVKAVTLMRGRRRAAGESSSTRLASEALLRLFRRRSAPAAPARRSGPLQVRHIMRSNVRVLPASARIDEVLRFVERSRDHHFPVVDDEGMLVGMIHFADLRDILYDPVMRDLVTAHDIARQSTPEIPIDMPLQMLFEEFQHADVGSLPVVAGDGSRRVVGMVEQRDLLRLVHEHQIA
ncbi:MAG: CBS domain-containing protein [Planctomycetota bacterium]|nr:MAG: CBS domain-containing protein [Planctomycetota bacterium]